MVLAAGLDRDCDLDFIQVERRPLAMMIHIQNVQFELRHIRREPGQGTRPVGHVDAQA